MSKLSYSGCGSFSSYEPLHINSNLTSFYFNYEAPPSICSSSEAEALAIELFRIGWVISSSMKSKLRNAIGGGFLASRWRNDPAWGSRQEAFDRIGRKVADFAVCSAKGVFRNLQRGWGYLKDALKNEKPAEELRGKVIHDSLDLGEFSDTPLIVSDRHSNFPNVVTPREFEKIQEIYEMIKSGSSGVKIEGSDHYIKSVLNDLRIILSTVVGRELIFSLVEKNLPIREGSRNCYLPKDSIEGEIEISNEITEMTFGAPHSDKINVLQFTADALFHELTHAYHHLITKDMTRNLLNENYRDNPWTNNEEKRTILKTNEFLRQLKAGEENWFGRCYHRVLKTPNSWLNFYPFKSWLNFYPFNSATFSKKIEYLLAYKLRVDEKKTASDSIEEFSSHIVKNPNLYLPAMAIGGHYDWIRSLLELTPLEDLDSIVLEEALLKASIKGYEEMVELLINLYPTIERAGVFGARSLLRSISNKNDIMTHKILNSCDLEKMISTSEPYDLYLIIDYLVSNKEETRALFLLNSLDLKTLKTHQIKKILMNSIVLEMTSISDFIFTRYNELDFGDLSPIFHALSRLGNEEYLQIILKHVNFKTIADYDLTKALAEPYYKKEGNVVELFIKTACLNLAEGSEIPEMGLGALLLLAIVYGDGESVEVILNSKLSEQISVEDLGKIFCAIAYKKNRLIYQVFQRSGFMNRIPIDYISKALTVAFKVDNEEVFRYLINFTGFEDLNMFEIEDLVLRSSYNGNIKFTRYILNSKRFAEISTSALGHIFENICRFNWEGLVLKILRSDRSKEIDKSHFQEALLKAKESGNLRIEGMIHHYLNRKHLSH